MCCIYVYSETSNHDGEPSEKRTTSVQRTNLRTADKPYGPDWSYHINKAHEVQNPRRCSHINSFEVVPTIQEDLQKQDEI